MKQESKLGKLRIPPMSGAILGPVPRLGNREWKEITVAKLCEGRQHLNVVRH